MAIFEKIAISEYLLNISMYLNFDEKPSWFRVPHRPGWQVPNLILARGVPQDRGTLPPSWDLGTPLPPGTGIPPPLWAGVSPGRVLGPVTGAPFWKGHGMGGSIMGWRWVTLPSRWWTNWKHFFHHSSDACGNNLVVRYFEVPKADHPPPATCFGLRKVCSGFQKLTSWVWMNTE